MSITLILGICLLVCDVLVYLLYEWAFGDSERIRKNIAKSRSRREPASLARSESTFLAR